MVDAACEPAGARGARVVALLIDRSICSGTLVNTLGGRREKPLLLTAFLRPFARRAAHRCRPPRAPPP